MFVDSTDGSKAKKGLTYNGMYKQTDIHFTNWFISIVMIAFLYRLRMVAHPTDDWASDTANKIEKS